MDTARRLLHRGPSYERIEEDSHTPFVDVDGDVNAKKELRPYSKIDYFVFLLLGVAMLWAWNMFLAAAPYFQRRFRTSKSLLSNFQAAEVSISTVANLGWMFILTKLQANANYPRRITTSLALNIIVFSLLALSTKVFIGVSAEGYFMFIMMMVFMSSTATGFMQNGAFSYAAGYGPAYLQAIMTGQAVAGVLPPIVQIASVISTGEAEEGTGNESSTSAMAYFFTATGVSGLTLLAFTYLAVVHRRRNSKAIQDLLPPQREDESAEADDHMVSSSSALNPLQRAQVPKKTVSLAHLARRLAYISSAVFLTFAITMVFPVFTQEILSTSRTPSPLFRPAAFIPLAFLVWNIGDLLGRQAPLVPGLSLAGRPKLLLFCSVLRLVFVPLYLLCNIVPAASKSSAEALPTVRSDAFYLLIVQLPFGLTNGYLGSCCMMGAGDLVDEDERESAGSFMGLMLVAGLAVGSSCSFFVGMGL